MTKPVINLDELEFKKFGHGDTFAAERGGVGDRIGAAKLGYGVVVLEPGKRAWPYHSHVANEEMFFILEGEGTLRHAGEEYPIRAGDFVASPADPTQPHQIVNSSSAPLKYLCVSTMQDPEICLYPDSEKYGAYAGSPRDGDNPRTFFAWGRRGDSLDYWDGEDQ
jgi:uncharacterized cupin superfamily protein